MIIELKKKDWSLFKSFVNLQQWEENNLCVTYTKNMETVINMYEIHYCACIYDAWAIYFLLLFFNFWLTLLIIYFVTQEPLLNEGRQFVNKCIKQLWIKFSNLSSEFVVHNSWHGIPCFFSSWMFTWRFVTTVYRKISVYCKLIKDQNLATFLCQIMLFFFKSMFTFFLGEVEWSFTAFFSQKRFLSSCRRVLCAQMLSCTWLFVTLFVQPYGL